MSKPGRNDPCRCGSGKKFKRCCGASTGGDSPAITDSDRANAYDLLEAMAHSRKYAADFDRAVAMTHEDDDGPLDDPDDDISVCRFLDWFSFDVILRSGRTLADDALIDRAAELTPGARRLVRELRDAPWRLLQVQAVAASSASAVCRDLLERSVDIRITRPWVELAPDDVVVARVVERDGSWEIEGDPAVLALDDTRKLVRSMLRRRREVARAGGPPALARMVEGAALLRLMTATDQLLDGIMETQEGDPVVATAACFTVRDRHALLEALARADDFVAAADDSPDRTRLTWVNTESPHRHSLGHAVIDAASLRIETFSWQRADRARARLGELAGDLVTFDRFDPDPDAAVTIDATVVRTT